MLTAVSFIIFAWASGIPARAAATITAIMSVKFLYDAAIAAGKFFYLSRGERKDDD